ncbi:MAG: 2-hydroxyacyl-CoA dehydratase family protein [Candidatus Nezhaarchaeota archaeon]|nr:2-hydroxyacyl-CoA dehydratase family protein [Candidatus Nezhaarchaeota archaeon]
MSLLNHVEKGFSKSSAVNFAKELHVKGKKVIGLISWSIPEEVIYAADVLPFRLFGDPQFIEKAHMYLPSWCCSYARSCLEEALSQRYGWLDGVIASKLEDTCISLFYLLRYVMKLKFAHLLQVPVIKSEKGKEYFVKEIVKLKKKMEDFIGRTISDEDLVRAIKVYNENRRLLKTIYEMRSKGLFPLRSAEVLEIVISSMLIPKEVHSKLIRDLLNNISKVGRQEESSVKEKVRLHISGSEILDPEILQVIEDCGAIIVSDDLNTGTVYFWSEVDEDKDPYEALAERYLLKGAPGILITRQLSRGVDERIEYMLSLIKEFNAEGVIFLVDRGCEVLGHAYPHLRDGLRKLNIPSIKLDLDYPISREHYVTRVRAFIEMVREEYA